MVHAASVGLVVETCLAGVHVEVTSRGVASLAEEDRLMPVLANLSRQYVGPEYGAHRTSSSQRVTAGQVDAVSSLND